MPDQIGKIDGVPQCKLIGGYYTQAEVDAIMALDPPWIIERLAIAQRNIVVPDEEDDDRNNPPPQ